MSNLPFLIPSFTTDADIGHGRIGSLHLGRNGKPLPALETPLLFPVVSMMTGTTPRGGGLWKYVLQADETHGLLRRIDPTTPMMTQVLHFLDFGLSPQALQVWREAGLRERYNQTLGLNCSAPIFLDSGGFKLLFNSQLDLTAYGLPMDERQAERIVELQRDLGGDLIATLDYPLPPGLDRQEAKERMDKSQANALKAALHLKTMHDYTPLLYVAVHGQDGKDIQEYVANIFRDMKRNGLADFPFGIAIGSLVPLRGAKKYKTIVELVKGAVQGIPEQHRPYTPVHVFGVTGNLIPLLVYLGVDTFDSSTYVQQARSLSYFDPQTHREHAFLEMNGLDCDCRICKDLDFDEAHRSLTSDVRLKPLASGFFRSKYYADIALHNLEMDLRIVDQARSALKTGDISEQLIARAASSPEMRLALESLADCDPYLNQRLSRVITPIAGIPFLGHVGADSNNERSISLKFTPNSFRLADNYEPPDEKHILLVMPCSGDKPYSVSRSHRIIAERLQQAIGTQTLTIHNVTLSGLYGPVPEEFEREEAIMRYDFRLDPANTGQIALCTTRMIEYLTRYGNHYEALFGYATSLAYRTVLQQVVKQVKGFKLYPIRPKARKLSEFFRQTNIEELLTAVSVAVGNPASVSVE